MLENEARMTLERMREALETHMAEADALGAGLLAAKLSEAVDVINRDLGGDLR